MIDIGVMVLSGSVGWGSGKSLEFLSKQFKKRFNEKDSNKIMFYEAFRRCLIEKGLNYNDLPISCPEWWDNAYLSMNTFIDNLLNEKNSTQSKELVYFIIASNFTLELLKSIKLNNNERIKVIIKNDELSFYSIWFKKFILLMKDSEEVRIITEIWNSTEILKEELMKNLNDTKLAIKSEGNRIIEEISKLNNNDNTKNFDAYLLDLIKVSQDPSQKLSFILANVLSFSIKFELKFLENFCKSELQGWKLTDIVEFGGDYRNFVMFILFGTDIQQKNPMWRITDPVNYLEKLSKEKNSLVYRNVAYYLEPVYNLELLDNPYGIKSLMKLPISSTKEITPNSEIDISINVYTAPKEYERLLLSIRKRLMEELLKIKDNLEQK